MVDDCDEWLTMFEFEDSQRILKMVAEKVGDYWLVEGMANDW